MPHPDRGQRGCSDGTLHLDGMILSTEGDRRTARIVRGAADAERIGRELGKDCLPTPAAAAFSPDPDQARRM